MAELRFGGLQAVPLVHGRLAFAMELRERLLAERFDALAVELPPSHATSVLEGIERLPRIHAVFSGDRPLFLGGEEAFVGYVPLDPADGLIEALRIANGERIPIHWVDAEIDEPDPRPLVLPDAHALVGTGLEAWYTAVLPHVARMRRPNAIDRRREAHMAARLRALIDTLGPEARILFVCGIGHWEGIRTHLEAGTGALDPAGTDPAWVRLEALHPRSLPHVLGEMPRLVHAWEVWRSGLGLDPFDPTRSLREVLLEARALHERGFPDSMERTSIERLRQLLDYARKLTICGGRLLPDPYTLGVAAKGTVGNDFAVTLLAAVHRYPSNEEIDPNGIAEEIDGTAPEEEPEDDPVVIVDGRADLDGEERGATPRLPGEATTMRPLALRKPPDRGAANRWRAGWNPMNHCSWPPEDVIIENFRDYVTRRALTMAGLSLVKTEPFSTSFKDGIAMRETLRDWHRKKIHVKEEPRVAGHVGALVLIFEEDDAGLRFPWRSTWMAEHEEESTLAFYGTDPGEDMVGPGIGRMHYGGCMFLFPPIPIPDVWDDLRFERARTPSERLLLAAIFHGREKFVVHVAARPADEAIREEASRFGRHIIHLPLDHFGSATLERLRRAHVLNGSRVRDWAGRFIP